MQTNPVNRLLLVLAACIGLSIPLSAQVKYSNEFLSLGTGARLMGMAGAGTAYVDDATAGYWNPSRLLQISGRADFSLMHSEYYAGLAKYDYGGVAIKPDARSAIGISFIRFAVDDIPNTLELIDQEGNLRYDRITTFSSADLGLIASYARTLGIPGLSIGGNLKIIYRHTGDFARAWGFGLDASASYSLGKWDFSVMARDVMGTFNAWSFNEDLLEEAFELTGNEMPDNSLEVTLPRLILGGARKFHLGEKMTLAAAADLHLTFDGRRHVLLSAGFLGVDPYLGGELQYGDWLFVRLGTGNFQWVSGLSGKNNLTLQPALGLGIQYKNFHIDYAINGFGDISLARYSNLISLRYRMK